ncbi:unnamed protein product [Heterobilharzia americana]|nr:unnamed protein product [Heterobilharzia americana]
MLTIYSVAHRLIHFFVNIYKAVAHRASLLESASSQQQRLSELDSRLTLAQTEVDSHKTAINEMRGKRDAYERDIREMTEQMEAAKAELAHWQREKEQLSLRMTAGVDMNPVMEQYKTLQSMREARIKTIEQLRNKLNELDQNMTQQGHELATRRNKIDDSQRRVTRTMLDLVDLRHSVEQKMQTYKLRRKTSDLSTSTSTGTTGTQNELYEAMFDFTARHPDELSFKAGALIDVFLNAPINVGPGWLYGQINDKVGLFPESNSISFTALEASTANNTLFTTTNVTNAFGRSTDPVDNRVKNEPMRKLDNVSANEIWCEVQDNWDASLSILALPADVQSDDQLLTVQIEDRVKIIKESGNKEWLYGEIVEKSGIIKKGWLPVSCLKPYTNLDTSELKKRVSLFCH